MLRPQDDLVRSVRRGAGVPADIGAAHPHEGAAPGVARDEGRPDLATAG